VWLEWSFCRSSVILCRHFRCNHWWYLYIIYITNALLFFGLCAHCIWGPLFSFLFLVAMVHICCALRHWYDEVERYWVNNRICMIRWCSDHLVECHDDCCMYLFLRSTLSIQNCDHNVICNYYILRVAVLRANMMSIYRIKRNGVKPRNNARANLIVIE